MAGDIQQEFDANQIARFVADVFQLEMKIHAMLPEELARIKDELDGMSPSVKPARKVNYHLFYRTSHNLYQKSSLTMSELSDALSVPLSTATGMVDWMVDNGYVQRLSDPEDRRIVRVALTDEGRKLHKAIENYMGQHFQQIFSRLTVDERHMFIAIIRKLWLALKEVIG